MKHIILVTLAILGFSACQQDPPDIIIKKPIDFLTEKDWHYLTFNNQLKPCDADDILRFSPEGQFTIQLGSNHCTSNEADQITGSWTLINDDTRIVKEYTVFGNALTDTLFIVKLDAEEFEFTDENHNNVVLVH